ncbi:MAG: glycosyltransferase family 4 protein, partial [Archaeoglobaceae archaeon]
HNFRLVVIGARTSHVLKATAGKDFVDLKFNLFQKEVIEILSSSKALILPSSYETFSYAVLEALACGTPAIVSEAIPDEVVINGFNGFRVRSFNPDDYAKTLLKIFENNDEWYRISKNAVEFSKQFDHIEIAKRYLSLISTSESLF